MPKEVPKQQSWSWIKSRATEKSLKLDYDVKSYGYQVFTKEGNTRWFVNLYDPNGRRVIGASGTNDADYNDFVNNHKTDIDNAPPEHLDGVDLPYLSDTSGRKLAIHESSRPIFEGKKFGTYYVGVDDDFNSGEFLGDPNPAVITVSPGEATVTKDFEFDPAHGQIWIHEGYAWWDNAGVGDYFSVYIVANATPLATSGVDLDYEITNNKIHLASGGPGTGTHGFAGTPVPVPNRQGAGHWNLVDGSLSPATSQDGDYDLYNTEAFVDWVITKIPVLGTASNYIKFQSADTSELPPGYKLRVDLSNTSDTNWSIGFFMTVYREPPQPYAIV